MVHVDVINQQAFRFNQENHDIILSVCSPLLDSIGIKNFRYMCIYNNFRYLSLGTNLEYLNHYLMHVKTPGNLFEPARIYENHRLSEKNGGFHYYLWPTYFSDIEKDPLLNALYTFNIWNGFSISKRQDDYVEIWSFASNKDHPLMNQFYINNTQLLERFALFFQDKMSHLIDNVKLDELAIFQTPFNMSFTNQKKDEHEEIEAFIRGTKTSKFFVKKLGKGVTLTPRELDCLIQISTGKTCKDIGKTLQISSRTVEAYINTIKTKTGLYLKSDLSSLLSADELYFYRYISEL